MSFHSKRRPQQHVIDSQAQDLFRSKLPSHWVVREYRPDYGIDFSVELFEEPNEDEKGYFVTNTLGEHLLFQLKGVESANETLFKVYGRENIEKTPLNIKNREYQKITTVYKQVETSELVTVPKMGTGLPVILVIADITTTVRSLFSLFFMQDKRSLQIYF
jgi:hypothetical protein